MLPPLNENIGPADENGKLNMVYKDRRLSLLSGLLVVFAKRKQNRKRKRREIL